MIGGDRDRFKKKNKEERRGRKRRLQWGGAEEKKRKDLLRFKHSKESEERNESAWEKVGLHARNSNVCVPWV